MSATNQTHKPKNVLVTGGCGFIGSNFVNYIFRTWPDIEITNLDKLILNANASNVDASVRESERYRLVLADIRNDAVVGKILRERNIDTVIHFAADCTSTRCYQDTEEAIENNVLSFIRFLETVADYGKVQRFVHISTDEIYGDSGLGDDETGKPEEAVPAPGNPYAATKVAGEAFVHALSASLSINTLIVRINNIYGPNQWDVKVVPRFIDVARKGEKFTVQGTGQQLRSWLFVDDASAGIIAATERGKLGETYNLGTYFEMNVTDLAHAVQKEVDLQLGRPAKTVEFVSIPDRPYNDLRYLIDISKAERELGWKPSTPFSDGLRNVVTSALKAPEHPVRMRVALIGGRGYVGLQMQEALTKRGVPFVLANSKVGVDDDQAVIKELCTLNVTHVVCATGRTHGDGCNTIEWLEKGADRTWLNLRDNAHCPTRLAQICRQLGLHYTYIGTGYIFAYDRDQHPVGGAGFLEEDEPTFFGSSYSIVKGVADRQFSHFAQWECINARITLPLSFDLTQPRNLLAKIITYKELFDLPVSISVLPDCLDALIQLMERRYCGALNLVNPEPISLADIVQLYGDIVDRSVAGTFVRLGIDTEKGRLLLETKGNCALDTGRLQKLCPDVPTAKQSLSDGFQRMKQ